MLTLALTLAMGCYPVPQLPQCKTEGHPRNSKLEEFASISLLWPLNPAPRSYECHLPGLIPRISNPSRQSVRRRRTQLLSSFCFWVNIGSLPAAPVSPSQGRPDYQHRTREVEKDLQPIEISQRVERSENNFKKTKTNKKREINFNSDINGGLMHDNDIA